MELARWALTQGLLVSPDHEDLVAGCLRTEYQAGNMDKVCELVDHLSATARRLGVDLGEDTTRIIDTVTDTHKSVMTGPALPPIQGGSSCTIVAHP